MRSYALALLAASGSAAMPASYNMGESTAAIVLSTTANQYGSIATGQTLKWAYDAAKVYVTYDAVGTAVTVLGSAATEIQTFGAKVKVGASGAMNLACQIKQVTGTTTTALWHVQPTTSSAEVTGTDCNTKLWSATQCMGVDPSGTPLVTVVGSATADGTAQTATAKTEGIYTLLATSTATLDVARKGMTCHIDMEFTGASLTANQAQVVGLNKINTDFVQNFGHTTVSTNEATFFGKAYFFDYTPTAPTAVASTATKFSAAAGQTVTGLVVAHTVNAWTSTKSVYIDYTWKMTLTDAIVATKVNSATTCSKIATAMWQCAIMETTEVSGNVMMKFKGYRSSAALTFVDGLPEVTANLGKVASVWKEYEMTNVAAGTAAATDIVSIPSGVAGAMLQSNQWAWYKTGNQMDAAKKVFDGKVQWFSLETTDAAATAVVAAVTEYAKAAWVGACLSATCKYGGTALAATSTAAAGAGSLGLASVGAAIVLAMAF